WARVAGGRGSAAAKPGRLARIGARRLTGGGWTLRLRVTDSHGNVGEDREYFRTVRDRSLVRGYPKRLGTSGEASPALADLNGDGAKDIVLATADGLMRVYSGKTGRMLPGWPRAMLPAFESGPAARRIGPVRAGFEGTPAVGDITGDRRPEIVDTGIDGRLYAWTARGRPLPGFPFRIRLHKPDARGL